MANSDSKAGVGSVFDLVGKSVEIVKRNWLAFALVNVFALVTALIPDPEQEGNKFRFGASWPGSWSWDFDPATIGLTEVIIIIAVALFAVYLYAMMTILQVKASAGEKPSIQSLIDEASSYWLRLWGLIIVSIVIVLVGLLLLIVPGVIAFFRLIMAPYLMVDKNLGIMDSIKASNELGKKHLGKVAAAVGVTLLISLVVSPLGMVPLLGNIAVTIIGIAISLVIPLRYHQLKNLKD